MVPRTPYLSQSELSTYIPSSCRRTILPVLSLALLIFLILFGFFPDAKEREENKISGSTRFYRSIVFTLYILSINQENEQVDTLYTYTGEENGNQSKCVKLKSNKNKE